MKGMNSMSEELCYEFKTNRKTTIRQYLLSGKLHEKYTDLNTYGIRIEKIIAEYGCIRSRTTTEMHGIFCRRNDADNFMEYIKNCRTAPENLSDDMDRFIKLKYLSCVTA